MAILVLLLFLLPFLEIYVLITVGSSIGFLPTVALVLGLSVFGAYLLRQQGLKTLFSAQQSLAEGHMPVETLLDGAGLTLAGVLMVAPGLITDAMGFVLLVPQLRRPLMTWAFSRLLKTHVFEMRPGGKPPPRPGSPPPGKFIDAEFHRVDDK